MKRIILASAALVGILASAQVSFAVGTDSFGSVTSGIPSSPNFLYFGSGNLNADFTINTSTDGSIELGLKAKERGTNTTLSQGGGIYGNFAVGTTPIWNFDFSINGNANGPAPGGGNLGALVAAGWKFVLSIDNDPSGGTNYIMVDPLVGLNDDGYGTNATKSGEGTLAVFGATNNVAQNSENETFGGLGSPGFNPNVSGNYMIKLEAFSPPTIQGQAGTEVADVTIQVLVGDAAAVPEPASLLVWGGLGALGLAGGYWRKNRTAKA